MTISNSYECLTDTCIDTLTALGAAVRHFSNGQYEDYYLTRIVTAMFEIAEVGVLLDGAPPFEGEDRDLTVNTAVLTYLLPPRDCFDDLHMHNTAVMLAEIASLNLRLAEALLAVDTWLRTREGRNALRSNIPQFGLIDTILTMASQSTSGLAA